MSGEPMVLKVVNKINGKLKLLYRKNKFLTPALRRMQCAYSATFDCLCTAWNPNLIKKKQKKRYKLCKINVYGFVSDRLKCSIYLLRNLD